MATPKFMQKVQDTQERLNKRGGGNFKKVEFVKFGKEPVTYKLRLLPAKDENNPPWKEYLICKRFGPDKKYLVPRAQYGLKPCPITDYLDELAKAKDAVSKKEYKDQKPKLVFTMFVINREAEDLGPLRLDLNQVAVQDLVKFFMDPDYGDLSDIEEGRDITVEYTPGEQTKDGFPGYTIIPRPRSTPLSDDPELIAQWTEKDLFDEYGVGFPATVEFAQAAIDGKTKDYKGAYATTQDGSPDPRWQGDSQSPDEGDDLPSSRKAKVEDEPVEEPEQESNPDLDDEAAELAKIRARKAAAAQSAPKGPSATDRIRASLKGKK